MSFTPPNTLQDLLIYVWKIVDLPRINKDRLINMIALDLYLASPPNARELIMKAINTGLLLENPDTEEIWLSPALEKPVNDWQVEGIEKRKQIQSMLNEPWRSPIPLTDDLKFNVYIREIADVLVWEKALKIRSSMINANQEELKGKVEGKIKNIDVETEEKSEYSFSIDFDHNIISHSCPEYDTLRKTQKKLCPHLAAVINRAYAKNKTQTMEIVRKMVLDWTKWNLK